jgi:DNA-directed RNA polymerase specialized sigma24 family protein
VSLNGPAAARLYDEHVDAIYTYAARRVGPDAAVKVVEEVFEQALRKNAERPSQTASDLGWLLAMATAFLRRHSETECRRLQAWEPVQRNTSRAIPRVSDPLLSNDAEDPAVTMTTQVMAAIAELEPVERDVLFLVAWEGCSSALTATATGLPQNEIRPTLTRIRKEIRQTVAASKATTTPTEPAAGTTTVDPAAPEPVAVPIDEALTEPPLAAESDADATEPLLRPDDLFAPFEDPS